MTRIAETLGVSWTNLYERAPAEASDAAPISRRTRRPCCW